MLELADRYRFGHMVRAAVAGTTASADENSTPPRRQKGVDMFGVPSELDVVEIRVGRWQYEATLDPEGAAVYTDRKGRQHIAPHGTFRVVAR